VVNKTLRVSFLPLPTFIFLSLLPPLLSANHEKNCSSHGQATTIIDKTYHYINETFCQPAIWFDDFFIDNRVLNDAYAGTMVRWYNDFSLDQNGNTLYSTKIRARVHLPSMTSHLKLVLEADAEDSVINLFPKNFTDPESSLGLNYDWVTKEQQNLSVKVTLKPSIEVRYRYIFPLSEKLLSRFTQKIYQRKKITGSTTLIDLDFAVNHNFLLRWANIARIETDHLLELGSGLTLYQYISKTQALNYQSSLTSQEKPYHFISNYHLSIAYRQNIFRKWFYYQIKPEINWYKKPNIERYSEAKITLRLEVLFDNI